MEFVYLGITMRLIALLFILKKQVNFLLHENEDKQLILPICSVVAIGFIKHCYSLLYISYNE